MNNQVDEKLINEHRAAVALTGNVSDFQLKNMKTWPFILFDNIKQVKIDYNFYKENGSDSLHAGKVTYNIEFDKDPAIPKEEVKKKLEHLSLWTKYLFWKDTEVEVQKQGKVWVA